MARKKKAWSPNGYLFAAFRKIWRWSPQRREILKGDKDGRFVCVSCKGQFIREEVAIDHKEPVIDPRKGFETWDTYYSRLFCPLSGLQVLCLSCHKKKTKVENKIRRKVKRCQKLQ